MSSRQDRGAAAQTPQQRLLASRRAIVQHMGCQSRVAHNTGPRGESQTDTDEGGFDGDLRGDSGFEEFDRFNRTSGQSGGADTAGERRATGLWRALRRAASVWWRAHPAHLAVDIAHPLISTYARAHPVKLLGAAAALGAVVAVARPWRLISVTGMLIAALRSTPVSHLVGSLLSPQGARPRDRPR